MFWYRVHGPPVDFNGSVYIVSSAAHAIGRKSLKADSVEVTWPSGAHQLFHDVEPDKFYVVEEGKERLGMQKFGR
jgi:hypothetical protein